MGSFNGLIVVLAVRILFLEISKCHANSEIPLVHRIQFNESSMNRADNISICTKVISYMQSQYVPYTETYRISDRTRHKFHGFWRYQIKTRPNYRIEYHVVQRLEEICCEGYVQIGAACQPRCPQFCKKGTCLEPDVCTCKEGYRMSGDKDGKEFCVPICANGCINGTCVDPDVCSCNDGYWLDSDGLTCGPICDEECERMNGYCPEPHMCFCRPGYKLDTSVHTCKPICDLTCVNGHCTAPNVCKCTDGYEADELDRFTCKPKCDETCVFGMCTAPGNCTCDEGYRAVNASVCEPICSEPCEMGTCVAPESCNCNDGYGHRRNGSSKYVCEPICEIECGNGVCTAPNVCTYDVGHHPVQHDTSDNNTSHICVPHVETACNVSCGNNEICTASGICTCNDDYTKDANGHCILPVCAQECSNGTCTAPNHCTCYEGFAPRNESFCEPICESCPLNSECVGPNQCNCQSNFVLNSTHFTSHFNSTHFNSTHFNFECVPACIRNCSGHGVCVIDHDYRCKCHFGWTGSDCDQPTMCVTMMNFDHSDINRITIRNDTNSTIMQAHENAPYCYQCENSLNNESLCYVIHSYEDNTTSTVGCLISTDLPCYITLHYKTSNNISKIVWSFVIIVILSTIGLIAAAYIMYHRCQKKKLATGTPTNLFMRESFATESLLSENAAYL